MFANVRRFRAEDADAVKAIAGESPEAANWSRDSYPNLRKTTAMLAL